jgi:hypothetical protein
MTFDEFLDGLPESTRDLELDEKESLRKMMGSTSLKTALSLVMLERSQLAKSLLITDLSEMTADKALTTVARHQGEANGLYKAVALLFELVEEEQEPPAEE